MASSAGDEDFPCSLTISIPLPTHRLASSALRALSVDTEVSLLVRRSFSLAVPDKYTKKFASNGTANIDDELAVDSHRSLFTETIPHDTNHLTILCTEYKATTNRMLRVAVNGFMESLGVVLEVMEELDVDVLAQAN